jgi:MFS family permease
MNSTTFARFQKLMPIYSVVFLGFIGYSLIITIFTPLLLYTQEGLLPAQTPENVRILLLGLVIFVYPFGQFLSSPILGAFSDRFGRRPILIFSLAVSTLVYALIGLGIIFSSLSIIILSLFIVGLSEGNITIAHSTVADVAHKRERSRFFGYVTFSSSLSYVFGPLLGGRLADPPLYSSIAFAMPFFVVSLLLFMTLCWIYFGFKESLSFHQRKKISYLEAFTNLKNLFFMRHVRFLFLTNFILYLAIFGYFQSFPIFIVTQFEVNVWTLSLFIAWSAVPFLIVNLWLTAYFANRFSPVQVAVFSAVWMGVFLEILLLPSHIEILWLTLFLVGLGAAACLPSIIALLSARAEESEQGRVIGINQSLQFFAEAFAGLSMGFLAAIFVKFALIIFGILSFSGALLLVKRASREFS